MKHLILLLTLTNCFLFCFSQEKNVDSLIKHLHNDQLHHDYQWVLETFYLSDSAAEEIIKIGKPASKKLIPMLDDFDKGIIVHFILCNIYQTSDPPNFKTSNIEDQVDVSWHGFHFFFFEDKPYAIEKELIANKKRWELFLKNKK